jgi:dethiobiotin synthetase
VPNFLVVAGTDTGVGKTFVTVALAHALQRRGARVVAVKPVESGCGEGPRDHEDGALLALATGQAEPCEALVRLRTPVTPALAADMEGVVVDVPALATRIRQLGDAADVVLVEGAGGLLSPLAWDRDLTHLARDLDDARVLLVGSDRLGVLHHVHATVQVLCDTWLQPLGVVLSAPGVPDASTGTNAASLRRQLAAYRNLDGRIVTVPRTTDAGIAADALAAVAGWLLG